MANVEKLSVAVTPEMAAMMRKLVESGEYASTSELMREALREWTRRRSERERALDELGKLWDEGLAGGGFQDADEAFADLWQRLEPKIGR